MIVKKTYLNLINFLFVLYIMFNINQSLSIIIGIIFVTSYINRQKEIIELFKIM
jgi:hypothetical protein